MWKQERNVTAGARLLAYGGELLLVNMLNENSRGMERCFLAVDSDSHMQYHCYNRKLNITYSASGFSK